jgi:UDP:flavonoid glycosyltransferase YjiC (YdhE family)
VQQLRQDLGLARSKHPLFQGQHSPHAVLALFSSALAQPQRDWPPQTHITGFSFFDQHGLHNDATDELPADLEAFLNRGEAPLVFTLGSAAVMDPRQFFTVSRELARQLGRRAVLLTGTGSSEANDANTHVADYVPFGKLLPRVAAVVHHGGIGTTAQTLRAGKPALVVAIAHDQYDNGARLQRLGLGAVLSRSQYKLAKALPAMRNLLTEATALRVRDFAKKMASEDGPGTAASVIERVLGAPSPKV